jgi:hypothetical protein
LCKKETFDAAKGLNGSINQGRTYNAMAK